ncbi:hypothetical protein [Streptomyces cinerochromogenes]|uniref:hypothetical protein n=1 Tax=Streptomyces cinerochromogenes TaxID=66422 RepID=UPI00167178C9|nr:hypothetical protein [Streptomyces cinerochromogenes]
MSPAFPTPPEPYLVPAGAHPLWEEALAVVNRDLAASLPGQRPLRLLAYPAEGGEPAQVYVALANGDAHGTSLEPARSAAEALPAVAEAAQDTVMECLWQVWPVCTLHGLGMHVAEEAGRPVWRCAGGGPSGEPAHVRAVVGELDTVHRPRRPNRKRRKDRAPRRAG